MLYQTPKVTAIDAGPTGETRFRDPAFAAQRCIRRVTVDKLRPPARPARITVPDSPLCRSKAKAISREGVSDVRRALLAVSALLTISTLGSGADQASAPGPIRIVLVGDSTVQSYPNPPDRSHFSGKSARAIARLVVDALPQAEPGLRPYLKEARLPR